MNEKMNKKNNKTKRR